MNNQYIDKLAWISIKDRNILSTRSKNNDIYYIPGGKRESGESDQEALVREIKEELSIDLVLDTIEYVGTFEAQIIGGELHYPEYEILDARWWSYEDLVGMKDKLRGNWILMAIEELRNE